MKKISVHVQEILFICIVLCVVGTFAMTLRSLFTAEPSFAVEEASPVHKIIVDVVSDEQNSKEGQSDDDNKYDFKYCDINTEGLHAWLDKRDSIFAMPEYYEPLHKVALEKDIDIILLISIIGQEQGFVSRYHKDVKSIAKNPFNVYGSWQEYGTSLSESAQIASNTIKRLISDAPPDTDIFEWINTHGGDGKGYAEDPHWWKGVSYFYHELEIFKQEEDNN